RPADASRRGEGDRTLNERWSRLSPLSPLVKFGGAPFFALIYFTGDHRGARGALDLIIPIAIISLAVLGGLVSWLVTRWRISGTDLQIEMGLVRRQSLRIPLERIQAVDVVSPLLARFLGLAEVRVISAGSGQEKSRLAYLRNDQAQQVRNQLLAL